MPEYDFVSIPFLRSRSGMTPESDYRDLIRERAADGWDFIQAIPFDGATRPHLDLVFVRRRRP